MVVVEVVEVVLEVVVLVVEVEEEEEVVEVVVWKFACSVIGLFSVTEVEVNVPE